MTSAGPRRRNTKQRAAVAAELASSSDFISAQDLHGRLKAAGSSVGLATVYRTLQVMAEDGDVDVLRVADGEAIYRRCTSDEHHHHLVCRDCGRTEEVTGLMVEEWADDVASKHGFSDVEHTVEIFGRCPRCTK